MHESQQEPNSSRVKFIPFRWIGACVACLLIAVAARHFLIQYASRSSDGSTLYQGGNNAPFITSADLVVEKMVEVAELSEDDLVYDLGCGDGRIVISAALATGCRGIGFDIDPQRVAEARESVRANALEDRVEIREQDIFKVDLSNADVALMYLLPWMMNELVPQFDKMKPGSRIVSHSFWIDGVEPDGVFEVFADPELLADSVYVYRTPLRKNPKMEKGKPPAPKDAARSALGGLR
jgi:SAM-dependent methyltransferase